MPFNFDQILEAFTWQRVSLLAAILAAVFSMRFVLTNVLQLALERRGLIPESYSLKHQFHTSLIVVLFSAFVGVTLPLFNVPSRVELPLAHTFAILLTIGVTWFFIRLASLVETIVSEAFGLSAGENLRQRRMRTQLQFIFRLIASVILIVGFAAVLLSFEGFRKFGTSLIASAGVASVVLGFAAQKSLGNLIAGFQIAFTQPLRIDDILVVEKEYGRVEEITLTYVVIRIWDQRRLVLPITYFVEKPFENWTRHSTDIMGTVFVYTDYSVPVEAVRGELTRFLKASSLWDGRQGSILVTNVTDRALELRALISARNASDCWDLRCAVREALVAFLQKNYPASLPHSIVRVLPHDVG